MNTYLYANANPGINLDRFGLSPNISFFDGSSFGVGAAIPLIGGRAGLGLGWALGFEARECCENDVLYREVYAIAKAGVSLGVSGRIAPSSNLNVVMIGNFPKCHSKNGGKSAVGTFDVQIEYGFITFDFSDGLMAPNSRMTAGITAGKGISGVANLYEGTRLIQKIELGKCCDQ